MSGYQIEFQVHEDEVRLLEGGSVLVRLDESRILLKGFKPKDENDPCEADHCGGDDCICDLAEPYLEAMRAWHNDQHPGVFSWCEERPCRDLREVGRTV